MRVCNVKKGDIEEMVAQPIKVGNCPVGNCPVGNCPVGNCPVGNCLVGNCPVGNCPTHLPTKIFINNTYTAGNQSLPDFLKAVGATIRLD